VKASILVIEDEVALRENICELLTLEGYGISEATDGIQGLEEAVQRHPDLILCDILMPRMNGKEFLAEARRRRELQDTPIVFLTALASSGEVRAGMNLGADDYITKPFSADDLIVTIETRLDRKRRSMQSIQSRVEKILWRFGDQTSADLNDPLNAIVLPARVLAERNQNLEKDDIRVLARGILNASSELSRNIDHLLWQQYLDQKIQSWQDDSFKLTTEWILSTLRSTLCDGDTFQIQGHVDITVRGSEEILRQILREAAFIALFEAEAKPLIVSISTESDHVVLRMGCPRGVEAQEANKRAEQEGEKIIATLLESCGGQYERKTINQYDHLTLLLRLVP